MTCHQPKFGVIASQGPTSNITTAQETQRCMVTKSFIQFIMYYTCRATTEYPAVIVKPTPNLSKNESEN